MTKEELDFIGSMNMCDEISNEAYKKIVCHCEDQQPCEDAVSRQAVDDLIAELLSDYLYDEDREKIEELVVKIEDLEPITPKEKTGKWIYDEKSRVYRCSCCNRFPWRVKLEKHDEIFTDLTRTNAYKFCPNCGARMVSE